LFPSRGQKQPAIENSMSSTNSTREKKTKETQKTAFAAKKSRGGFLF
jgi:hypothetical protein